MLRNCVWRSAVVKERNTDAALSLSFAYVSIIDDMFQIHSFVFKSEPPMEYVPTHPNDVSASEKLFDDFGSEYKKVDKGGNTMAVMRLIESSTSLYSNLNLVSISGSTAVYFYTDCFKI